MKHLIIVIVFFTIIPSYSLAQKVSNIDVRGKLMTELINREVASRDMIRSVTYTELKHKCSIPLTFGIYSYAFPSPHIAPGVFMIVDNELTFFSSYDYDHIYQKINSIFKEVNRI